MGKSRKKDLCFFLGLLFLSIAMAIYASYLFYVSFNNGKETRFNYSENSSLNYKVWLKENDFYSEEYLGENYDVVASAIDNVEISFDYLLNAFGGVKGQSYYTINSYIEAYQKADEKQNKVWNYKEIIKDKNITKYDKKTTKITAKDDFKIDYQAYKKKMENYQQKYGVSLVGNLVVEIEIKSDLKYSAFKKDINLEARKMTVTIPLTDSIITISKHDLGSNTKTLIEKEDSTINYPKLVLSLLGFILEIIIIVVLAIDLVKLLGIDSKYIRELRRILKAYDSVIVNVNEIKTDNKMNIMHVSSFEELLDAQAEIRTPILYCDVIKNKEAKFAIKNNNDMFVYKMKSSLYDKKVSDKNEK